MSSPYKSWNCVTLIRVVLIMLSIEVGWHYAEVVSTVLLVVYSALNLTQSLSVSVAFVGSMRRPHTK